MNFAHIFKEFNPDQPRVPAGQSGGGQWTATMAVGSTPVNGEFAGPLSKPSVEDQAKQVLEDGKKLLAGQKDYESFGPVVSIPDPAAGGKPDGPKYEVGQLHLPFGKEFEPLEFAQLAEGGVGRPTAPVSIMKKFEDHAQEAIDTLDSTERAVLADYTNEHFANINRYVAGREEGSEHFEDLLERQIGILDTILENNTIGMNVLLERKMAKKWFVDQMGDPLKENLVGQVYEEKAFASTTLKLGSNMANQSTAGGALRLRIRAREHSKGLYVEPVSENQGEMEVLLPRGSRFIIRGVQKDPTGKFVSRVDVDLL